MTIRAWTFLIGIVSFIWGFIFGSIAMTHKMAQEKQYNVGEVSFCQLNEGDRFKVCPMVRTLSELSSGGAVIVYICNEKVGYIETNQLTPESQKFFMEKLGYYKQTGVDVKEVCKMEKGSVFKLVKNSNG